MRFDKRAWAFASAAFAAAPSLGYWAAGWPGALAGLGGLVSVILWEISRERGAKRKAQDELLENASITLAPPQIAYGGAIKYLRPEAAVVSFWPRQELVNLREWLISDQPASIWLVTGEGGAGKTRLALQLAREAAREYGWRCYWVPAGGEGQVLAAVSAGGTPVLVLVDYAETRDRLAVLLGGIAGEWVGPVVRVLLLARSAGEWWDQLITSSVAQLSEMLAVTPVMKLGPLSPPSRQSEVFRHAMEAFAAEMETDCPSAGLPAVGPDAVALVIHSAALLAVLDHAVAGTSDCGSGDRDDIISGLLRHEARYWRHSRTSYALDLGAAVTERVIAAGTLVGADDEESAAGLLAAIRDLADPGLRGKVARWLHDLYPAAKPGLYTPTESGAAHGEWISPLRPDVVAEHFIVKVLTAQPHLTGALLSGLTGYRAARALTVLASAALAHPSAMDLFEAAIASNPADLILPAMTVATETSRAVGGVIASALKAGHWPPEFLAQVASALPGDSVALAETAAIAYQCLAETSEDGEAEADNLRNLSIWLWRLGRREAALDAVNRAVAIYRDLAEANPGAFFLDLAGLLINQALFLAELGHREDALDAIDPVVTICRDLVKANPDALLPNLAASLHNQALFLADLGRSEEALDAINQAVVAYRDLAEADPDAFLRNLAKSLVNQAGRLAELGRREDALDASNQAVTICRDLAEANPDAFLRDLAASLNDQSLRLADLGRSEDALYAINQAVVAYRDLAEANPDAFLPELARSLSNQGCRLASLGRREDGLEAINQAVTICRDLAAANPDAFLPDLAASLNNQSLSLADLGRYDDAMETINQAVAIRHDLAAARPGAFLPDLAASLHNQSLRLADLGRNEDALDASNQAVTICRDLAAANPDAFLPELARSLDNQGCRLASLGRYEDGLEAINQAVAAYHDLASARPDVFHAGLAGALNDRSNRLTQVGRHEEALEAINQAVAIRRDLAAARPDTFLHVLAASLTNQASRLAGCSTLKWPHRTPLIWPRPGSAAAGL